MEIILTLILREAGQGRAGGRAQDDPGVGGWWRWEGKRAWGLALRLQQEPLVKRGLRAEASGQPNQFFPVKFQVGSVCDLWLGSEVGWVGVGSTLTPAHLGPYGGVSTPATSLGFPLPASKWEVES